MIMTPSLDMGQLFVTLVVTLFLPGYLLGLSLFPSGYRDKLICALISIGGSVALSSLTACAWLFFAGDVTRTSFLISTVTLCFLLGLVTTIRRPQLWSRGSGISIFQVLRVLVSDVKVPLLMLALFTLVIQGMGIGQNQRSLDLTEFYVLPAYAQGEQVSHITGQNKLTIPLGINNQEGKITTYHIEASIGSTKVGEVSELVVQPGSSWQNNIVVQFSGVTTRTPLELSLFKDGDSTPIANLRVWIGP